MCHVTGMRVLGFRELMGKAAEVPGGVGNKELLFDSAVGQGKSLRARILE